MLLILPILVSLLSQRFDYIIEEYLLSFAAMVYLVITYLKKLDGCKNQFENAN
jgi:hypothetical protein